MNQHESGDCDGADDWTTVIEDAETSTPQATDPLRAGVARYSFPFRSGQLVVRLGDGALLEIVEVDLHGDRCMLEDGGWVRPREIEEPLRASYLWDVERGRKTSNRLRAVAAGDFDAVFPKLAAARRRDARRAAAGFPIGDVCWVLVTLEAVALLALLAAIA